MSPLRQVLAERATNEAQSMLAGGFDVRQIPTLRIEPHRPVVGQMEMIVRHLGSPPHILPSALRSIRV
jgi:hypothetical protein